MMGELQQQMQESLQTYDWEESHREIQRNSEKLYEQIAQLGKNRDEEEVWPKNQNNSEIPMDNKEYFEDEQPLEIPCNSDKFIPTPDRNNDHLPIQKEEPWNDRTIVVNGIT